MIATQSENIQEWGTGYIERRMGRDAFFRLGVANLFFKGATTEILSEALATLSSEKIEFLKA